VKITVQLRVSSIQYYGFSDFQFLPYDERSKLPWQPRYMRTKLCPHLLKIFMHKISHKGKHQKLYNFRQLFK